MSKFVTKMYICLTEPRKIGFFMGEKKWKSLLQLFLFLIIALTPFFIKETFNDKISDSSKTYLQKILMNKDIEANIKIENGTLIGDSAIAIQIDEGIVFINPNNEKLDSSDYKYLPVYEMNATGIKVTLIGNVLKEISYKQINFLSLDFNKIFRLDYVEFNYFIGLINNVYSQSKSYINLLNFVSLLVTGYISLIFSALIICLFGGTINKFVAFKFRFKGALDAQFISIFFILLSGLFNVSYLELIGVIFSVFYFTRGLTSIVRIEVRKIDKEEK